ncbi:MAG: hypothetical protein HC876_01190 [Chloroflexaceae bacterium]|nr:hypothetical protein [Chloroflexaceae bacterium]
MMMTPNTVLETWIRLLSEVSRGSTDAVDTMKLLTSTPTSPDDMLRLMRRFMPTGTSMVPGEALTNWMEEYWRMMGVVPRHRYLELLERNEDLRRRLDVAEKKIQQIRQMKETTEQTTEEAQRVVGMWTTLMAETIRSQTEWLNSLQGRITSEDRTAADGDRQIVEIETEQQNPETQA